MTSMKTKAIAETQMGELLPELAIPVTVTLINGGAIATRDYFPGHHDADAARELGSPHIFMNILTTTALVQRFVEQWAGPLAILKDIQLKLGAPNYPGDTMTFSGEVVERDEASSTLVVSLKGKNSMGNHATGKVTVVLPA
ncbi:MaoC family dehydratase [Pseudomonas marincola]|uniref:MaoC family dehydratase n=1 Tax=Pseudomonas marincola TaxID=437900 RepID=UPI0008E201C7|nr:MaoC family dehydratase [Pseudomonas marincola]SFU14184.1 MaoC like domain-containing protein [Pseudomonas marincola]